ncbi:MAG: hypothetical protein FJ278_08490, partial [Planctomycetes bacterium]|nr:hypothetical protein [Planctomycetota bacterium]
MHIMDTLHTRTFRASGLKHLALVLSLAAFSCTTMSPGGAKPIAKTESAVNVAVQLTTSTAEDSMGAVSRDGRWIVFVSDRSGNKDLWLKPADARDSSPARQLTDHTATDTTPCWSPNGKKIAFVSTRNDAKGDIFVLTVSSGALERLTDSDTADDHPTWSPDGKDIVFTVTKRGEPANLWQVNLKTKAKAQLTQKGGYDAAFSPDGRYLCFTSSRTGQTSPTDHIAILRLRDRREATLTQGPFADGFASWADDGQSIVFTRFADDTNGDDRLSTEDNPSLWRVAFSDFLFDTLASAVSPPPEPLQLASSRFYHIFPQQKAGQLYFTSNRNNNIDLWVMPAEGDVSSLPTLAEQFKLARKLNQARPPDPYLAIVGFRNVVQRFPAGDKATLAEARYETGRIFEGLKNPRQALDEYSALTAAYPEAKKFCGLAEVAVARIQVDLKAADAVKTTIKSLESVAAKYAGEPAVGAAAHLEMGRLYETLKDNVSAVNVYQTILKTYPKQSSDCAQAILRKAAIYKAFGDEAALLDAYLAVLKDYPGEREWGGQAAESALDLIVKADLAPQEKIAKLRQVVEKYKDVAILPAMA